ncbi:hypothetical protein FHL15_001676 [Xylaria flabelliformis]|uniref:Uncharacterized protein n=1 Tax=Xylaria flabelliformis TaxID=2512241 RepID=A0A553IB21_9PEZI|nr:hypothetical protein FHL15_001676 [Xylaria flabelliformis]
MLSVLVAVAFLAIPSSAITLANTALPYEQSPTRAMIQAETNATGVTASTLIPTFTPSVTHTARGTITVIEGGHNKLVLAWFIISIILVSFIVIALTVRCIMIVDWTWLWRKMPINTSNGVRDLELGLSGSEQVANTNVEVVQSGGQPFMNKNMTGNTQ